ncbi:MAG TPA: glycine cleavage T C-terminal barrel domain-containing protein, partial [Candidatus Limnocylindria bacterium]|nr:glycine cleavage T C-terminal barrel domain-containing protein [Candidatus Limnocylindria bacterium]
VWDLSFRGRICLTGADRVRLLNGQVTNDVKKLEAGQGCYAALVTAKGKMQADLNIHALSEELLLDFEPGLTPALLERFDHYIVADDVQVVDVAPYYGLISVQGPLAPEVVKALDLGVELPARRYSSTKAPVPDVGELYIVRNPRLGTDGVDLYVPTDGLGMVFDKTVAAARALGGGPIGWTAAEVMRIEAGIPRFGADMDETNLPPEAGLEGSAISYSKGCYIGQEVIARIKTYGQVAKALRGLWLPAGCQVLPAKGDKLTLEGKEIGYVTGATTSPKWKRPLALGYIRRECNQAGTKLILRSGGQEIPVTVALLPWKEAPSDG